MSDKKESIGTGHGKSLPVRIHIHPSHPCYGQLVAARKRGERQTILEILILAGWSAQRMGWPAQNSQVVAPTAVPSAEVSALSFSHGKAPASTTQEGGNRPNYDVGELSQELLNKFAVG